MASVQPPPLPSQDTYSRFRVSLSLPSTLSALHAPPFSLPPLPLPPLRRYSTNSSIDAYAMPPPPVPTHASVHGRKRKHGRSPSPAPESSASPPSEGDSEYDPRSMRGPPPSAVKGKKGQGQSQIQNHSQSKLPAGVKSGAGGRPMSREQLRKANHSLIERRRREKINSALADLRAMVPGLGEDNGGKGGEFKLEVSRMCQVECSANVKVLERTVEHMRELKRHVSDLELQLGSSNGSKRRRQSTSDESMDVDTDEPRSLPPPQRRSPPKHSSSPPSPSMTPPSRHTVLATPDPNETEDEQNLPPPLALASRDRDRDRDRISDEGSRTSHTSHTSTASPHPPSISSLLSSAQPPSRTSQSRPAASPNIYLPFPTPSPTSPFLSYHPSNASTASSATGPPEPSPFLAPMQNISLFDGQLNASPLTGPLKPSPPESRRPLEGDKHDMGAEEAASLLLAISSPDTLRPTGSTGNTPLMSAVAHRGLERRLTLDAEEFTLDGGVARSAEHVRVYGRVQTQGKTARDILRM